MSLVALVRLDSAFRTAIVGAVLACGCGDEVQEAVPPDDTSTSSAGDETIGVVSDDDADETSAVESTSTGGSSGIVDGTTTTSADGSSTTDDETSSAGSSGTSGSSTSESSTSESSPGESSTGESSSDGTSTSTSTSDGSSTDTTTGETSGESSSEDSSSSDGGSESTGSPEPEPLFVEHFDGVDDGAPWPAPWAAISQAVLGSDVTDGMGRLAGTMGFVARMAVPGFDAVDVDVTLVVVFEDPDHQGAGFYVRQNGGALHETEPPGEGYEIYLEGDVAQTLSVWREVAGNEFVIESVGDPIAMGLEAGVPYALRFQCEQAGAVTELRVKAWPADDAEPDAWQLETTDATPSLQNAAGSFAFDLYNYFGTNSVYVDDIVVTAL